MLSYKLRKGTVTPTDTTLYHVFEEARNNGANTEFYFMQTGERVFLRDVWKKVSLNNWSAQLLWNQGDTGHILPYSILSFLS